MVVGFTHPLYETKEASATSIQTEASTGEFALPIFKGASGAGVAYSRFSGFRSR